MKKGFTLVELIATLIILALVSLIVVPNIDKNLRKIKAGITEVQKDAIIEAAKYWMQDNENLMQTCGTNYVALKDFKDKYLEEKVFKNTEEATYYENLFVEIKCELIEADENNNSNYKYSYTLYDKDEKLLYLLAEIYVKNNSMTTTKTLSTSDLVSYLPSDLMYLKESNTIKSIESNKTITSKVIVTYENGGYTFSIEK